MYNINVKSETKLLQIKTNKQNNNFLEVFTMKNYNIEDIRNLLNEINDTVQESHPDEDDDVGAIVWNACLGIAEHLGITL